MLKQSSKLVLAALLLGSVAFVSCNNEGDKKTDTTTVVDSTKMTTETKTEPVKPAGDSMNKMDSGGVTKPIVPGKAPTTP